MPLPGALATAVLLAVLWALLLAATVVVVAVSEHTFRSYSIDPAAWLDASPFVGLLSHVRVLLAWGAASACVVAGAFVARVGGWRQALPLLAAAAAMAYLALDELFRFHEYFYPRLGVPERAVLIGYAVAALAFLWWYRDVLRRHEWPLLGLAFGTLGASVLVDFEIADPGVASSRWFEDCLTFFGIAFLALYVVRLSGRILAEAYPTDRLEASRTPRGFRKTALLGVVPSTAFVALACVLILGAVAALVAVSQHPFVYYSENPTSTFSASPLLGVLSYVGVLLIWGAAFVSVYAGAFVAGKRGRRHAAPLLALGIGVAYLALDDLFLLHEKFYPRLGIAEDAVFVAYVVVALAFLWWYRDVFRRHEWPLLAFAFAVLGASILVDLAFGVSMYWLEDSLKLYGLALLAAYLVRFSARMFSDAYPVTAAHPALPVDDLVTESAAAGIATDSSPTPDVAPRV
jgi:hypothetical protein